MKTRIVLVLAVVLALNACSQQDNDAAAAAAARIKSGMEGQAAAVQSTAVPAVTQAAGSVPKPADAIATAQSAAGGVSKVVPAVGGASVNQDQVRALAQQALARAQNVPAEQVQVERVEQVQWSDSSLGCAETDKMYAQVITPGFRVVATVAGQRKEVHADTAGRAIICDKPTQ